MNKYLFVFSVIFVFLFSNSVFSALTDNLTFYASFNNGSTSSIIGPAITNSGTSNTSGILGDARYYDGSDFMNISSHPLVNNTATSYTIQLWVTKNGSSSFPHIYNWVQTPSIYHRLYQNNPSNQSLGLDYSVSPSNPTGWTSSGKGDTYWSHYIIQLDRTNARILIWENATVRMNISDASVGIPNSTSNFILGGFSASSNRWVGAIDEVCMWTRTITYSEIQQLYNNGSASPCTSQYFEISAVKSDTGESISSFSALVNGTLYNTTTGTIITNILTSSAINVNVTLNSSSDGGYYNFTYYNYNVINSLTARLFQSQILFTGREKSTNNLVLSANFSIGSQQNTTLYLTAGQRNITGFGNGYYSKVNTYTISALSNTTQFFDGMYNTQINVTARDSINNTIINNLNANVSMLGYGSYSEFFTTSNGILQLQLMNGTHSIRYNTNQTYNYATLNENFSYSNGSYVRNISMNRANSITYYIYNQSSLAIINTTTVTVTSSCNGVVYTNTTSNGTFYNQGLPTGQCNITATASGFSSVRYIVTVGELSSQTLNMYMTSGATQQSVFTIVDSQTSQFIQGAIFSAYTYFNGSYTLTNVLTSDITGRVLFDYVENENYRFTVTKGGYSLKEFTLSPIIFSTYTVNVDPTSTTNLTYGYSDINILLSNMTFVKNTTSNYNFTFISYLGSFSSYSINMSVNGINGTYVSGSSAYGGVLSVPFTINSSVYTSDQVYVVVSYTTSNGVVASYTYSYNILQSSRFNLINKRALLDMSLFDKIFVSVFVLMIASIVGYMFSDFRGSLILTTVALIFLIMISFISMWFFMIPLVYSIALIYKIAKGDM